LGARSDSRRATNWKRPALMRIRSMISSREIGGHSDRLEHRADGLNTLQRICHGEDVGARKNGRYTP
jgi:hypothetical protein